ncbi:hypothetical protein L2505_05650 [Lactobacillus gasseri]|nr:hypothetical protein [Lactobacillus gasseri]MCZ3762261.1 hypothetical protein [Lactobacillus gasseri]MCZ3765741.1 hypothetical protein [Lactobacillus gasseri]MCZ3767456.1 hypothetical protein [Lactobacillus gasseri]MCZ3771027.1 hypothetical protein [Lactobacillus gasseri]
MEENNLINMPIQEVKGITPMNNILFIKHGKNLDENIGGLHAYLEESHQESICFPLTVICKGKAYSYSKEQIELAIFINSKKNKIIVWRSEDGTNEIDLTDDKINILGSLLNSLFCVR